MNFSFPTKIYSILRIYLSRNIHDNWTEPQVSCDHNQPLFVSIYLLNDFFGYGFSLFKECPHPDEKQRLELSRRLCLETRQVKFWFQNRRTQMKVINQIRRNLCNLFCNLVLGWVLINGVVKKFDGTWFNATDPAGATRELHSKARKR